jgi:transposase
MPKGYREYRPDQDFLLPPSLSEWLAEGHLAYFVSDVVEQLDLTPMHAEYGEERRGQPPYDPRMMTKLLVYGNCVGVYSSRKIQLRLQEDVAFRVLAAGNAPDFRTISDFRKIHLKTLSGFFEEVLKIVLEAGAMKLGRVALDGTKIKANASKHKAMSYDRMAQQEEAIREQVKELMAKAAATDAEEDTLFGKDKRGDEFPEELERRETRLDRIREAKRVVEERAREKAKAGVPSDRSSSLGWKAAGKPENEAEPDAKSQYNFTDPESRIMKSSEGLVQAYNGQIAVEPEFQLIVGQLVTQAGNDKEQVRPMVQAIEEQSGQLPAELLADAGYCSASNLEYLESEAEPEKQIDAYVATGRQKHSEAPAECPRGSLPQGATRVDRMRRKLQTKAGAAIYARRKAIVEPVFGQIKQARGFRRFSLRGLIKVQGEWALVCLTHNILKMYRMCNA